MMRVKVYPAYGLLIALLVIGDTTTSVASCNLKWGMHHEQSVNLYRALFEYIGAVMKEGIPQLDVPPLDPYYTKVSLDISHQQSVDPKHPNYTNLEVHVQGVNVSGFSDFEIKKADLNLDDMSATLQLYDDLIVVQLEDVRSSAMNGVDGNLLRLNCSSVYTFLTNNNFESTQQLELDYGNYLHVKTFKLEYGPPLFEVRVYYADCNGDFDILSSMVQLVFGAMYDTFSDEMPAYFEQLAFNATIILNDIFSLRNVTDDLKPSAPTNSKLSIPKHENNILDAFHTYTKNTQIKNSGAPSKTFRGSIEINGLPLACHVMI